MGKRPSTATLKRQRGAAVLGIALVLIVAIASALLAQLNQRRVDSAGAGADARLFEKAREALLGYAYSYPEIIGDPLAMPGSFPCPDFDGDGDADAPCNAADETSIGRLPWRTLGLPPLRDAASECLWYAVSSTYKTGATLPAASDTDGRLLIENEAGTAIAGSSSDNRAIVALFAAGKTVATQNRSFSPANETECGATNNAPVNRVVNYLDVLGAIDNSRGTRAGAGAGNPGSDPLPSVAASVFVSSAAAGAQADTSFNDRLGWIAPSDLTRVYERMNRWVANRVTQCLLAYGNSHAALVDRYPWAASLNAAGPVEYFDDNGQRFGRIPSVLTATTASNPGMTATWPVDPLDASSTCFNWPWWAQWQEQVFYAVADSQAPVAGALPNPQVDGGDVDFVVIVAGRAQAGQQRTNVVEQGQVENYLEGENQPATGAASLPPGDEDFSRNVNGSNDTVCDSSGC